VSRFSAYLRNAAIILDAYKGTVPLAKYLKDFFKLEGKYGANDRRQISALCYRFFRLGNWADQLPVAERILLAEFIISGEASPIVLAGNIKWNIGEDRRLVKNEQPTGIGLTLEAHTPWHNLLQHQTDLGGYVDALLKQPDLFLRIRPGRREKVMAGLQLAALDFQQEEGDAIRLSNASKVDTIFAINKDAVIQDVNSQKCGQIIKKCIPQINGPLWDVCAASGGKSLLLYDLYQGIQDILVSDIRNTILHNLHKRFKDAGITKYRSEVLDATKVIPGIKIGKAPHIILVDAPCSGSGTWARTPEQHRFFKPDALNKFHEQQYLICKNAGAHLVVGNYLIYITCSVFHTENEAVVQKVLNTLPLKLINQEILDGTRIKADSMFIAVMQKI
jgi:16S rRNA (cytosine967-C5)-methyltransferase